MSLDLIIPFPKIYPTETLKRAQSYSKTNRRGKIICSHAKFETMQMVLMED